MVDVFYSATRHRDTYTSGASGPGMAGSLCPHSAADRVLGATSLQRASRDEIQKIKMIKTVKGGDSDDFHEARRVELQLLQSRVPEAQKPDQFMVQKESCAMDFSDCLKTQK